MAETGEVEIGSVIRGARLNAMSMLAGGFCILCLRKVRPAEKDCAILDASARGSA